MAKKALVNKADRSPSSRSGLHPLHKCGRPHAVYRKFGLCRICLREMAMRANCPACRSPAGSGEDLSQFEKGTRQALRLIPEGTAARKVNRLS